jgi:hypothetical protein
MCGWKAQGSEMDNTDATNAARTVNSYLNYAFWALALISAAGIAVAILVSR